MKKLRFFRLQQTDEKQNNKKRWATGSQVTKGVTSLPGLMDEDDDEDDQLISPPLARKRSGPKGYVVATDQQHVLLIKKGSQPP